MQRRVFTLVLLFAVVAALGFASGAQGGTAATGAAAGTPKYGGTVTQLHLYNMTTNEPPDWDPVKAAGPQVITYSQLVMEQALEGDIEKFGPRGDNTYGFTNPSWVDEPFYKGNLVESWTWTDPLTLTFKVRKGIKYSGISANPGVMKPREFVASDFVYHLMRMKTSASKGQLWDWVAETSAPDDYTWVVKFKQYYADWSWWLASAFMQIYPKEVVEAPGGASDWKNLVGTGPFTLTEYVRGSHTTYTRNPTYWGKATIGGKEYQVPFVEKVVWPMITDESTQIASLRTGKVDWMYNVSPRYGDTLTKTSPELKRFPYLNAGSLVVALQCSTSPYFKNEKVRQALFMATDMDTIGKNAWGAGNYDVNPLVKGSALYVPIASMPAATKELFTYNPTKAKQMLADAGYPNGFSMEMTYDPSLAIYKSEDIASMLVDMWSKVGVKVSLKPVESAVYTKRVYDHTYTDSILAGRAFMAAGVSMAMGVKDHEENTGAWVSDEYTKMYEQAYAERDAKKSIAIQKDMVIKFFDGASMIPTPIYTTDCWAWSWVKNYYGEISAGFMGHNPMLKLMWIDQDAKKKLGF